MLGRGRGCREEEMKTGHDCCEAKYRDSCLWSLWMGGGGVAVGLIGSSMDRSWLHSMFCPGFVWVYFDLAHTFYQVFGLCVSPRHLTRHGT